MKKIAVGILAHVDSGKTTLSEALMYCSGNITKLGRVDHRDSFLDTFSLERDRGITIFSKQAVMKYNNTDFTLLDTPGHIDFSAEAERTLQVLDYAILVISGTNGVQSHTATLWKLLKRYNVPCFIFVNKMDLDGADKLAIMAQLRTNLDENCVDFTYQNTDSFRENVAVCDEQMLEKYYETESIEKADIIRAIKERKLFPCMFGSALKLDGVREFLALLDEYTQMPDYPSEFGAKAFKIANDNQGNRLTFMKVTGGSLKVREVLKSDKNVNAEKVNRIRVYSGEKFTAIDEAAAGTVCAVTGITFAKSGDGLGIESDSDLPMLEPVLTYKVDLTDGTDPHTALAKLKILENEDPQLNVVWNSRLAEIQIQLMGEIQLEVLKSIIFERFGMTVEFSTGNIIYKETIENTVEGVGHFEPLKHYAEVHLLIKPLKRGSGIIINSRCKEDQLDRNWQRLILTHLHEKTHLGVLTGSPITDVEITLVSGRAHAKHTEGGDFRQATYRAVRQGLRLAKSILLEPVYEFTLEVPNENIGRAMSDIQRMNGTFSSPESRGDVTVLNGTCPVSEMRSYTKEVMQYTHGKGKLTCILKGYEPCHNAGEVIESIGYDCDADSENPCGSVFCSHGAGYNVAWNEVSEHMHLPSALTPATDESKSVNSKTAFAKCKNQDDVFALDKELMQIFEQTYGPVTHKKAPERRKVTAVSALDKAAEKLRKNPQFNGTEYLLVDGYNVIFAWEHLKELTERSLDGARQVLINILCNYQGYSKCNLILVFDAYRVKGQYREVETVNGISIVYTKEAETADMYIEKVTHKLAKNNRVRVVTSDALEQMIILGNGALRVPSLAFLEEVRQAEEEIRNIINNKD
ncbi:GTP-binding protein [Eubacterium sp. OM08-24]|uniref:translation factor GTPase family protein n=1 Tax=Eubacterium sp. OM08-24 TaxID=2292352 RepID=UPI000E43E6E4|nr:TetM/TetW/TetO/TetS family tetracycline resistance ribosomal protection protein [Eubacterium sp. OM08-24]RGM21944.1 GTP-binding protein [Eubacterium sp. OM08-24]